jgi:aspartate 1-decarboxylase
MKSADLVPFEKVAIYNVSNGERFSTYAIKGKKGSGVICLNGAAARKVSKGDLIIIASYVMVGDAESKKWAPKCVHVDAKNKMKK